MGWEILEIPFRLFINNLQGRLPRCVFLKFAVESFTVNKVSTDEIHPSATNNFTPKASEEARQNQSLLTCEGTVTREAFTRKVNSRKLSYCHILHIETRKQMWLYIYFKKFNNLSVLQKPKH